MRQMANVRVVSDLLMVILALDQATHTTGWSLWQDTELTEFGKFSFDDISILQRIHKVCVQLQIMIIKYKPDKIVFEDIQMQGMINNVQTFKALAQLQGAIVEICYQQKIPYEIISPNEWRSACKLLKGQAKDRNSQKRAAQSWVRERFGKVCTQDEADAICIGYAANAQSNELNWE